GAVGDGDACLEQDDPLCEGLGLLELMRRQQHGAALADMCTRRVPHAQPGLAVESRGRLVERDESRSAREGERDRDQSPLAAREPAELPAEQPVEPEALGEHARVKRPRVVAPDELDYLRDTKRRWKGGLLVRDADASPRRGA